MLLVLSLLACGGEEPPPSDTKPANACALTFDTLDGTAWVYVDPQKGDKPNPMGRMRFAGAGSTLTAKYTSGADVDVYHYSCTVAGSTATCLETASHADSFCKAWAASHDGVCDPAAVASATGIPVDEVTKAAETVNKMLKGLNKAQTEVQRREDNRPANKIRGKFIFAIDSNKCDLVVQDHYLTLVNGQAQELSNPIEGHFAKAKEDYTFLPCKDTGAWAGDGDQHTQEQAAGPVRFRAGLPKDVKADAACTYAATVHKDWVKVGEAPGKADPKLGILFETAVPVTDPGAHYVYLERTKTCAGATESLGVACTRVDVP